MEFIKKDKQIEILEKALELAVCYHIDVIQDLICDCKIEGGILSEEGYSEERNAFIKNMKEQAEKELGMKE